MRLHFLFFTLLILSACNTDETEAKKTKASASPTTIQKFAASAASYTTHEIEADSAKLYIQIIRPMLM